MYLHTLQGLTLMRYGADVARTLQGIMLAESAEQRAKIEGGGGDITDALPKMLDWEIRLSTFNAIKTAARDLFRADLGFGVHELVYKSCEFGYYLFLSLLRSNFPSLVPSLPPSL